MHSLSRCSIEAAGPNLMLTNLLRRCPVRSPSSRLVLCQGEAGYGTRELLNVHDITKKR